MVPRKNSSKATNQVVIYLSPPDAIGKILEKLILKHINHLLNEYQIVVTEQFGFRQNTKLLLAGMLDKTRLISI